MAEVKKGMKKGIFRSSATMLRDFVKNIWDEVFQLFVLGYLLGMKKEGKMAEKTEGIEQQISGLARIFHPFSHEDEIKWNKLFSAVRDKDDGCDEKKFMKFLSAIVEQGYDEDTLRIRLIGSYSEKKDDDPAIKTIKSIANMDGDFDRQIKFAKNRKLLVKKGFKNFIVAMWRNKIATLLWIGVGTLMLVHTCKAIFG